MLPSRDDLAWIRRFRRSLVRDFSRLVALCADEHERPPFEVMMSDLVPLLDACVWHEKHARRTLRGRRIRHGGLWRLGQRHFLHRLPLGHVAIIATWNYPYQLLGIQLLQAIAAGNRVTVKPSERAPRCQQALLELAREAGLTELRLTWTESTRQAGRDLLEFGQFDHVVFTGSTTVGRTIATTLAATLTPSTLELSGSDSAIVLANADVELAADSIYFALTLNAGQSCMASRRVIVEAEAYDRFVAAFRPKFEHASQMRCVRGVEADHCRDLVERARLGGAEITASQASEPDSFAPTAVLACPAEADIAASDHFGPALAVIRSDSRSETIALAESSMKSLATSVFTNTPSEAETLAEQLSAGFVTINDCLLPTAHPGASISGYGSSGWGVSRGELGLLAMTRPKFVSRTSRKVRIPTDEPSQRVQQTIERYIRWRYK